MFTGPDDCAAYFEVGKDYLVFASWSESRGALTTNVCMQTSLVEMSVENVKRLGKPKIVRTDYDGLSFLMATRPVAVLYSSFAIPKTFLSMVPLGLP